VATTSTGTTTVPTAAQLDGETLYLTVCEQCHTIPEHYGIAVNDIVTNEAESPTMQAALQAGNVTTTQQLNDIVTYINSPLAIQDALTHPGDITAAY